MSDTPRPSFLNTPLDDIRGDLTSRQMLDTLWFIYSDKMRPEVKATIILAGRDEFLRNARKTYGPLGMTLEDMAELWARLKSSMPGVAYVGTH